jgi:hypothetical protein
LAALNSLNSLACLICLVRLIEGIVSQFLQHKTNQPLLWHASPLLKSVEVAELGPVLLLEF